MYIGDFSQLKSRVRLVVTSGSEPLENRLMAVLDNKGILAMIGIHHLTLQIALSEFSRFEAMPVAKIIFAEFGSVELTLILDEDRVIEGNLFQSDLINRQNVTIYVEPAIQDRCFGWFSDQTYLFYPEKKSSDACSTTCVKPVFNALVLTSTENCNAACRHCAPACAPSKTLPIDVRFFSSVIRQAADIPAIKKEVAIVGGEPTIYPKELSQLLDVAQENGFTPSITTNGWWGQQRKKREQYFREFQRYGLRRMELSVDVFHQEFIPLRAIENILEDARHFGVSIITRSTVNRAHRLGDALRGLRVSVLEGHLIASSPLIPLGRAAELLPQSDNFKTANLAGSCRDALNFTVRHDGVTTPCCVGTEFVPFLHLGNARERPISVLVERFLSSFVLRNLTELGPMYLLRALPTHVSERFISHEYVGICHLCSIMSADVEVQRHLRQLEISTLQRAMEQIEIITALS